MQKLKGPNRYYQCADISRFKRSDSIMRTTFDLSKYAYDNFYPDLEPVYSESEERVIGYGVDLEFLHDVLEIKTPYKLWFNKLKRYGYTEGTDYFYLWMQQGEDCENVKCYYALPEMAIDICLMQKTDKGEMLSAFYEEYRQARISESLKELEKRIEKLEKRLFDR